MIRQALVAGEIRPGSICSASGMASRLGTSNGPVCDAVPTLVNQGVDAEVVELQAGAAGGAGDGSVN